MAGLIYARADLPTGYAIEQSDPNTLTKDELETVLRILAGGGAVNIHSARDEIPQATALVLARKAAVIVGLGVIKRQRPWYAKDIQSKEKSGFAFDANMAELGYVAIAVGHTDLHLSGHIVDVLIASFRGDLFATTDHDKMKHVLSNRHFVRCGAEWQGDRGVLSLWILEQSGGNVNSPIQNPI